MIDGSVGQSDGCVHLELSPMNTTSSITLFGDSHIMSYYLYISPFRGLLPDGFFTYFTSV